MIESTQFNLFSKWLTVYFYNWLDIISGEIIGYEMIDWNYYIVKVWEQKMKVEFKDTFTSEEEVTMSEETKQFWKDDFDKLESQYQNAIIAIWAARLKLDNIK